MPKADGNRKPKAAPRKAEVIAIQPDTKFRVVHSLQPWSCVHKPGHSIVEAYVMAKGDWETMAEVKATAFTDPEEIANFIARAANDFEHNRQTIRELIGAIDLCQQSGGLSWEAEQEAEIVTRRARELVG